MRMLKNKKYAFKTNGTKLALVLISVLMAIIVPIQLLNKNAAAGCTTIASCEAAISTSEVLKAQYEAEVVRLSGEAQTLASTLARLENEKAVIQAQVDISQLKYDKLTQEIANTEKKIADNKDALGVTIANMYVDGNVTPIEMLASSGSIGDYLDKQEYSASVRDELTTKIGEIKALKTELDAQKVEAERVLNDQIAQRDALSAKEAEHQQLLAETQSNSNAYQELSSQLDARIAQLRADRIGLNTPTGSNSSTHSGPYAVYFRNWSGNVYCGGGYEYCNYDLDDFVYDQWGLYLAGECVHYAAWALADRGYYIPYNAFSVGNGYGGGNANKWVDVATNSAHLPGKTAFASLVDDPQADDLAFMPTPGVGHVGIVESNYGNGWVRISQYNFAVYDDTPMYSTVDLKITSDTQFLRFYK